MLAVDSAFPGWRKLKIHESSPCGRGFSILAERECRGYVPTVFIPNVERGSISIENGLRCEDLERQTFRDEAFDIVITQDIMEHLFDPATAHREIWRTLRPGGAHIFTTPIYKELLKTECCAKLADEKVVHLCEPDYHDNPSETGGSLVTFKYGYDLPELITAAAPFDVELRRYQNRSQGIVGEYTDVMIARKFSLEDCDNRRSTLRKTLRKLAGGKA